MYSPGDLPWTEDRPGRRNKRLITGGIRAAGQIPPPGGGGAIRRLGDCFGEKVLYCFPL